MWIPQTFAVMTSDQRALLVFWSLKFIAKGFCCWKNKEFLKRNLLSEFDRMRCTWKEAGFLAYNHQWTGLQDLFIIIYTSSTYYLLIILNLTCSLGDVEGGWILGPPIIHGRGCGALEQSPRYWEGSMKVQIRKYGGGNYDGIGQKSRLVWGRADWHRLSLTWDLSWVSWVWLIWSHLSHSWDIISQPVQPKRTVQVCSEDASAVQPQSK